MKLLRTAGLAVILALASCTDAPKADPEDAQYKLGYAAGQQDEQNQLCERIEDYKDSIAEALRNEGICP